MAAVIGEIPGTTHARPRQGPPDSTAEDFQTTKTNQDKASAEITGQERTTPPAQKKEISGSSSLGKNIPPSATQSEESSRINKEKAERKEQRIVPFWQRISNLLHHQQGNQELQVVKMKPGWEKEKHHQPLCYHPVILRCLWWW